MADRFAGALASPANCGRARPDAAGDADGRDRAARASNRGAARCDRAQPEVRAGRASLGLSPGRRCWWPSCLASLTFTPARTVFALALAIGGMVLSGSSRATTQGVKARARPRIEASAERRNRPPRPRQPRRGNEVDRSKLERSAGLEPCDPGTARSAGGRGENLERAKGFEPSTPTLARRRRGLRHGIRHPAMA